MRLTEQQRAELERRGWWLVEEPAYGQVWRDAAGITEVIAYNDGGFVVQQVRGYAGAYMDSVLEFAAIVGLSLPGYRLVPEEVVEKALPLVQALAEQKRVVAEELIGAEERAEAFEEYRALMALASALQGEVEKR